MNECDHHPLATVDAGLIDVLVACEQHNMPVGHALHLDDLYVGRKTLQFFVHIVIHFCGLVKHI